ncbi:MAG: hypothetical protein LBI27_07180 [Clostridiales bacterium]|jgi:hypothetical protein|nr:hypothetical protein [Clostridiales bacterium]
MKNTVGRIANAAFVVKHATKNTIGTNANAKFAEQYAMRGISGTLIVGNVLHAVRNVHMIGRIIRVKFAKKAKSPWKK